MKKFYILILSLFVVLGLNAQDLPMIVSEDALRTYALEQSSQVSASIYTNIQAGDGGYVSAPVESATAKGVIDTISHMSLSVDVVNPKDWLYISSYVTTTEYDMLFYGSKQFFLEKAGSTYVLPANYGDIVLFLASEIPIKIDGADYAAISFQDNAGRTTSSYGLNVRNGKLYFPRQLAGKNATLSVYKRNADGSWKWVHWNTTTGKSIQPLKFGLTPKASIDGIVPIKDGDVVVIVPTVNSVGKNKTVEFTSTVPQALQATFMTSEGKSFKGVQFRKAGTTQWTTINATYNSALQSMTVPLILQTGVYYIIPLWNDGEMIEPTDEWFPPQYNGGGSTTTTPVTKG